MNLLHAAQTSVEKQLQSLKDEIETWGEIKKESGRNEHLLQQAAILLAFQKDKAFIVQMPPNLIISLLRSIDIYIQVKLPTAETKPSRQIYERDRWGLSSMYTTKVTSVSSWLLETLTNMLEEGKL